MHIVAILVILSILFVVCVSGDGLPSIACGVVVIVSVFGVFVFVIKGESQIIALESTEEAYTLIDQGTEEAPCYVVVDGGVAHFICRNAENEAQVEEVDMDDISVCYQSNGKTVIVERTSEISRKVWLFIKGFYEEKVEHHYSFYVPEGSIMYTYVNPQKPG